MGPERQTINRSQGQGENLKRVVFGGGDWAPAKVPSERPFAEKSVPGRGDGRGGNGLACVNHKARVPGAQCAQE